LPARKSNKGAAPNGGPALQSDGSDNLFATIAADRAFPAAVAILDVRTTRMKETIASLGTRNGLVLCIYAVAMTLLSLVPKYSMAAIYVMLFLMVGLIWANGVLVRYCTNLIAGSPRQMMILERLEPCEAKVSRTVLRGGLSGRLPKPTRSARPTHTKDN
jgi:hypothetical protein